ncbi:Amidophosphoribosyltransferase [Planctomycetes bacterium Pan216]|uniref:Amidophosphoribosyltransferase n=1 Tax=Kolteria novifilia TaxID=2527975 RepID=A0A518BD86_9BACT|nr:Amidophosphoribosyltransferase [Planctomycetes bacterium Pan216]
MAELHHECGIVGIYHLPGAGGSSIIPPGMESEVSRLLPRMLLDLQNRGQLAAGISTYRHDRDQLLDTYREIGSVIEAFRLNRREKYEKLMTKYAAPAGIGHVRYATCGREDRSYAQPFERHHGCKWKWFSFAFNGQLANYSELAKELLEKENYHLTRQTDTEVIQHHLSYQLRAERPDLVEMFRNLAKKFDGAYNLLYLNAMGELAAIRDPLGIRPLCYAVDGPLIAFASESVALLNLGFQKIESMEPGEIITIQDGKIRHDRIAPRQKRAHCFFEWIYFANVASVLDSQSVYQTRARLGQELARTESLTIDDDTIVVPVPDTAKAAADAMAYELRCPSMEGLIRNRYVGRTFIEGNRRGDRVKLKYTPLREVLEGRRVILVEDTIVRSTTMKALIKHMRSKGGAREIHVRVACPPIVAPCFYGIDMSTVGELFAPKFLDDPHGLNDEVQHRMAESLEADTLRYLPIDALARAIGLSEEDICQACVTGDYPTAKGQQLYQIALGQTGTQQGRTYEQKLEEVGSAST